MTDDEIIGGIGAICEPLPHSRALRDRLIAAVEERRDSVWARHRSLRPVLMETGELASLLHDLAERIEEGDSFEGNLMYLLPDVPEHVQLGEPAPEGYVEPGPNMREVVATFRIGNREGQGGVRMVGEVAT